jgi:hypothetical protein
VRNPHPIPGVPSATRPVDIPSRHTHAIMIGEYTLVTDDGGKSGSYHHLRLADGLAPVLDRLATGFRGAGEGVVLLRGPAQRALGLPDGRNRDALEDDDQQAETLERIADSCRAAGWRVSKIRPWTTFHGPNRPPIHIGMLTYLCDPGEYPFATNAVSFLDRPYLHRAWRDLTGSAFRGTPGVAGTAILRDLAALQRQQPTWQPSEPGRIGMELAYQLEHWRSPESDHGRLFEHGYDLNYMYLGAWVTAEVSAFGLRRTGAIPFDRKRAGWWLVDIAPWNDPWLPDPAGYTGEDTSGARWVTTPTLALLEDLTAQGTHGGFEIHDSWTGPASRAVLQRSGEKIRDALYMLDSIDVEDLDVPVHIRTACPVLIGALKEAYRQAHGLMNREGGRCYRPDWYSAIVAQARSNLFRKLWTAYYQHGHRPLRVDVDNVWYASDSPDPVSCAPPNFKLAEGTHKLGAFHHRGTKHISRPGGAQ